MRESPLMVSGKFGLGGAVVCHGASYYSHPKTNFFAPEDKGGEGLSSGADHFGREGDQNSILEEGSRSERGESGRGVELARPRTRSVTFLSRL